MFIRKVLFVFKLALVLTLSFVIIRTVILPHNPTEIFQPASAGGTENVSFEEAENTAETSVGDYSLLVTQNIFGVTAELDVEEKTSEVGKLDNVVVLAGKELSLELVGTVCGNTDVSRAIIFNTKNKQLGIYKTGQDIAGAIVKSIHEDAVILLLNGQRKMLMINRVGENNNTQALLSPVVGEAGKVVRPVLPAEKSPGENPTKITQLELILNDSAIEPYLVDGLVEGLRITDLDKIPMAKTFGLKNGDVISRVNGHLLTGKQKAFQVFKKAKSQTSMNLELLRDGETKELSFDLQ